MRPLWKDDQTRNTLTATGADLPGATGFNTVMPCAPLNEDESAAYFAILV